MMKVKIYYFFIFSFFCTYLSQAQSEEYYIAPSNRSQNNADITSAVYPNLDTKKNYFYIDAKGVTFKNFAFIATTDERYIFQENLRHIIPEFMTGVNIDDKQQFEIFYQKWITSPNFTITNSDRTVLSFTNKQTENIIGFRYKKKLFLLDKITKSTYIYPTFGIRYNIDNRANILNDQKLIINIGTRNAPTILNVDYNLEAYRKPFSGEVGIELRNRIAPPIEIALHSYLIMTPKGIQETNIKLYNGPINNEVTGNIKTGFLNPTFGVSFRYNFLISKTFISKI